IINKAPFFSVDKFNKFCAVNFLIYAALLIIDIDYFKSINDTYGHLLGDKVLIDVAKVLDESFAKNDIVGRLGGDEFSV
ncbi:GGDEF domain-containing protein, partial [Clostridioides difficile]|uniref:GGDEF domain-containing protein n=1 Tax=Clostridioides difficile TaxID=1496 RepID=UPI001F19CA43